MTGFDEGVRALLERATSFDARARALGDRGLHQGRAGEASAAIDRNRPVSLHGLADLRRFSASRYPCSEAQGVCFTALDRVGQR